MKGKKEKKEKGSVERIEWRGRRGVRKGQDNFPLNSFYKLEKKKDIYLNEVTALTWHSCRFRCHLLRVKRSRGDDCPLEAAGKSLQPGTHTCTLVLSLRHNHTLQQKHRWLLFYFLPQERFRMAPLHPIPPLTPVAATSQLYIYSWGQNSITSQYKCLNSVQRLFCDRPQPESWCVVVLDLD